MFTARTLKVAGVDPWQVVTVNQGVGVVTLKVTGVAPVDKVTASSPLFCAVYATEKSMLAGVAIIGICTTVVDTVIAKFLVSVLPQVSDALRAKLDVPSAVGVPPIAIAFPAGTKFNPGGNEPEASVQFTLPPPKGFVLHVPVAFTYCWYAAPIAAFGRDVVVITNVPGAGAPATVIVKGCETERPCASVTVKVKPNVPGVVGTPVTEPFVGPSPRPGGNVPVAVHKNGAVPPDTPRFTVCRSYGCPR